MKWKRGESCKDANIPTSQGAGDGQGNCRTIVKSQ